MIVDENGVIVLDQHATTKELSALVDERQCGRLFLAAFLQDSEMGSVTCHNEETIVWRPIESTGA
jgi:hypothetical protein